MTSKSLSVLDSHIAYLEEGEGDPIVFLHGNPTSSFLWRNVIPHLSSQGRCLAPDLIGFGHSGKPAIDYRFFDHTRYLDAWFEALGLTRVTLVLHDWGGALGIYWARRHSERVAAIAMMEALLREIRWEDNPEQEQARKLFQAFRTPGIGEKLIMQDNVFIEQFLPAAMIRKLTESEMNAYREPFLKPEDRKPVWRWPNELPINGEPADVVEAIAANVQYLRSSPVPKLLLAVEPGAISSPEFVEWCRTDFKGVEVQSIGPARHFAQEDQPDAIGEAIANWRGRVLG